MLCVRVWSTAPGPTAPATGSERIGIVTVAPEHWSICLKDSHPAYVDWDELGSWWTTSIATIRAGPAYRAKAMHCCRYRQLWPLRPRARRSVVSWSQLQKRTY